VGLLITFSDSSSFICFSVESENGFGVERTHESTVVYAQEARVNLAQGKKKVKYIF
jgi:hypothetical protein